LETSRRDPFPGSFRLLFEVGTVAGMSDGELLDRFQARRTVGAEAAEIAFGAIIERHGPMVLRVCQGQLGDEHDAQDAFQATFLILARKADSIRNRDSAASWLQGVARRVAACARRASAVRRAKERAASRPDVVSSSDSDQSELAPAVREEVSDLPEKYRTPLMLCLLNGLTHEEVATRLGWPVGTVKTRVRQAKDRLRTRLTRRGFAPSVGVIAAAMTAREASAIPLALVRSTARAALRYASGKALTAGAASASVATLVELGIGSLLMSRIKLVALILTTIGAFAAGTAGHARQGTGGKEKIEPVQVKTEVKEAVEPPKVVEVTEDDLFVQLENVKLEHERHKNQSGAQKTFLLNAINNLQISEQNLKRFQSFKNLEELREAYPDELQPQDTFESARDRFDKEMKEGVRSFKDRESQSRSSYHEGLKRLRREEQQIKDLEDGLIQLQERGTEASKAKAKKRYEVERAEESNRLDQVIATNMKLDMLRSEFEFWKNRVFSSKEASLDLQKQARNDRKPYGMTEKEFDAAKKLIEAQAADAERETNDAKANYEEVSHALVLGERELRNLEKGLSPVTQTQYNRWKSDAKRPDLPTTSSAGSRTSSGSWI
jgi:RNA polymerase sigma factor (sigma-70 family)